MKRFLPLVLIVVIGLLVWFSLNLAISRIYQVDECTEVYTSTLVASGQAKLYPGGIGLLQFPLSWLARNATNAADLFAAARFIMLEVFWLNVVLLALATGERFFSTRGLVALVGAATLAPLWDYGFEIRHDNLLLTGMLLTWCLVRVRPSGLQSYLLAGALAIGMQSAAHKAFAYVVPLSLMILIFPPPGHQQPRWKLALAWATGALIGFIGLRLIYALHGAAGLGESSEAGVNFVSTVAASESRFWPGMTLARLLSQTPLLLALVVAAAATLLADLRWRGQAILTWDGCLPEALLFLGALGLLFVNPTPFPYNLLHLVPFAFLLAFRYGSMFWQQIDGRPVLLASAVTVLIFTHLVAFGLATRRHLIWTNFEQTALMKMAEDLTDPIKDPVYDGIGMVPTRQVIHPASFLHSLSVKSLLQKDGLHIRDMLAAKPATVIIPSYRTDWLMEEDHEFIREHYVPLADDFWVLGKRLPAGGGSFEIIHPGRYQITAKHDSCIEGTGNTNVFDLTALIQDAMKKKSSGAVEAPAKTNLVGTLDGDPLAGQVVELTVGTHRVETSADIEPAVVWVGPKLELLHPLGNSDHRRLFVNWY